MKLSNLVLDAETLGREELKQIFGGNLSASGSYDSRCNVICKSNSDCWGKCHTCKDIPNWVGSKACY